jgi:phage tail sheath gpL-like
MSTPTSISFTDIPNTLEVPGAFMEFSSANASNGASALAYVYLIMGQMLSTGTAQPLVPVRISNGKSQADSLFGQGSMLSNMVAGAVGANAYTETWAMPVLDNTAGIAASGSILFAGTATESRTTPIYIGYSGLIDVAEVAVTIGETAAEVAAAAVIAVNDALDLPVTAAVDATTAGKVDITARHKGVDAGNIDIRLIYDASDVIPAGLTVTITAMSGGSGNPSSTPIIAALSDKQYHVIACPWNDTATYTAWNTEMTRRWNALVHKEGALVTAIRGTPGTINAALDLMNSKFFDCYGAQNATHTTFLECAVIGAVYAYNLSQRPNAPQKGAELPGLKAPALADQFTLPERNAQYLDGGSCWIVEADGTVVLERAVTTYKTNASGAADTAYHGRWVMATLMYLRTSWDNWMSTKFPNVTFANDGTPVITGEVTPTILKNETLAWYKSMMNLGLVQDFAGFKSDLLSLRNIQNHARNDQLLAPRLVGPLDIIAGQMAFEE